MNGLQWVADGASALEALDTSFRGASALRFEDALARVGTGIPVGGHLRVARDLTLEADAVRDAGGETRVLHTPSSDEQKRWLGFLDEEIDRGIFEPFSSLPSLEPAALAAALASGDPGAIADLYTAAGLCLYGRSAQAQPYREIVERHRGPFVVALYVLDRLTVERDRVLTIDGLPATLLVRHLTLERGARIVTHTTVRVDVGTFEKQT